jgi:hypothetical protein
VATVIELLFRFGKNQIKKAGMDVRMIHHPLNLGTERTSVKGLAYPGGSGSCGGSIDFALPD